MTQHTQIERIQTHKIQHSKPDNGRERAEEEQTNIWTSIYLTQKKKEPVELFASHTACYIISFSILSD